MSCFCPMRAPNAQRANGLLLSWFHDLHVARHGCCTRCSSCYSPLKQGHPAEDAGCSSPEVGVGCHAPDVGRARARCIPVTSLNLPHLASTGAGLSPANSSTTAGKADCALGCLLLCPLHGCPRSRPCLAVPLLMPHTPLQALAKAAGRMQRRTLSREWSGTRVCARSGAVCAFSTFLVVF